MSEAEKNKVQFNLKNVHYAAITSENGKSVTYGTPVAIPGAVSLTLDPEGGVEKFYADGIVYYQSTTNNGYSGDCEVARFPDQMLVDIWQYEKNTEGVIVENADVEPKEFALLYQIDGDKNNDYYLLYRCTGTRPGIGGETNGENKEVKRGVVQYPLYLEQMGLSWPELRRQHRKKLKMHGLLRFMKRRMNNAGYN